VGLHQYVDVSTQVELAGRRAASRPSTSMPPVDHQVDADDHDDEPRVITDDDL